MLSGILLVIGVMLIGVLLPEYLAILSGKVSSIPSGQNIIGGIAFGLIAVSQLIQ